MRWCGAAWVTAAVVVLLAGCGASGGGGSAAHTGAPESGGGSGPSDSGSAGTGPSDSGSLGPSPSTHTAASPPSPAAPSPSAGKCAAGHGEVAVSPGDPVRRELCVRPGTVVTLVLRPRVDDKRWTGVESSAPALVVPTGWRVEADGTAHAALRCAGTRGGAARVTVSAKAPDVAGAPQGVFTLDLSVVPYARNG
ncbi:hypothetical protein J2Z21_002926 [Streptomyces griseochromogenes]|uniref:Uncharacterized protein n=1 Tax=Streptomyces griseochromogenes TaxID=68214 RepID=A0ABS4LRG0_9ACTN|nr:hypothetical protein [Streptomyces griseochromogenes]MBP2049990.1 hypothetical protein [Streptomyces griseochromogenes]